MTIRQALAQFRLGCHDTMSAFWLYRICHGGYWVRHRAAGWYTVQRYRYDTYNGAGAHPSISELEDNSDPWQIWGVRIVTGIIAASGVMVAVILS
jgi:hypothetical protein